MINFGSPFRRPRQRSTDTDPRGQILLIFAFGLIVFIGLAALTVDVGSLYVARRNYQNATDAAALAGRQLPDKATRRSMRVLRIDQ